MSKWVLAALMALCFTGCADEASTRRTLASAGYTEVTITGWSALSCGQDDTFSTGFEATNPAGRRVTGVVCCGLVFKSCTVRH